MEKIRAVLSGRIVGTQSSEKLVVATSDRYWVGILQSVKDVQ